MPSKPGPKPYFSLNLSFNISNLTPKLLSRTPSPSPAKEAQLPAELRQVVLLPDAAPADALGQAASWGLPDANSLTWTCVMLVNAGGAVGQTNDPIKKHYEQEKILS